ncbi:MAG: hypothetical protein IT307_08370 [Chloroflexi bacterium]|nr:hypothetical protein [Chloroflexota bacterium]
MTPIEIRGLTIYEVTFPFRFSFGHALARRASSSNVLVRVETSNGAVGFGEAVPRTYVTGETPESVVKLIGGQIGPTLLGRSFERLEDLPALIETVFGAISPDVPSGAARCGVELAVLDAAGRALGRSAGEVLGPVVRPVIQYSGVFPLLSPPLMAFVALAMRAYGISEVKLKVGRSLAEDLRNLKILRAMLGASVDIRVDANCAWSAEQAIEAIVAMRPYRVATIEQPVAQDDLAGFKRVSDAVEEPTMADESLCTIEDARRLADGRTCDMFNIRISKCGGLLAARSIVEIASSAGMRCQMGAQVGESAVLSAAGRHFAARTGNLRYFEGSAGSILLKQDIADRELAPGRGGKATDLKGPGLGVRINEAKFARYVTAEHIVS